jgi:two-component system sensor histidine kinase PilS (NtrC family)
MSASPAPAPEGSRPRWADPELHRKLVWLTFFRLVTITVLLGGTAAMSWGTGPAHEPELSPLYILVIVTYVASLGFALALRTQRAPTAVAYAQIALDVALAGAVVSLTGGRESIFVFLFSVAIVNGSILLFRRGAMVSATLAVTVYLPLALVTAPREAGVVTPFVHVTAFVATAALASYLSEQLRSAGERLAASESDLAALSALHASIVQSMGSGLVTMGPSGAVTFMNPAAEQMTGLTLAQVRGRDAAQWFSAFQSSTRGEADLLNVRGVRLRLGYSTFPLADTRGKALGTAVIFQDLTSLRAMEEAVTRSERLADLGRVAAGLAHELRNPLASMMGSVELLRSDSDSAEEGRRLLGIVLREAGRLEKLVTEFLAFARPAPLRPRRTDLALLAGETLDVFAHDPTGASLTIERALSPASADVDPDRLRQVLWNLLLNARQAVEATGRAAGRVAVAAGQGPAGPWLSVEDDGIGIDPADRQRIFVPFYSTREQGTGLGLATVHRVVEAHGGSIEVESEPGRGARFTVRLPPPSPPADEAG